jgi:thiamine biosynthesis lipoprotein
MLLVGCSSPRSGEISRIEEVFTTPCSIRLVDGGDEKALDAAFQRLHQIDSLLSSFKPNSDISAINRAAGREAVVVSQDTFEALKSALDFARLTEGIVDPTVGPLSNLWGIGTDHARVPPTEEIASARKLINWKDVILDESARSVRLSRAGMELDLGAFAKGWAADDIGTLLASRGVKAAIIDLGGNIDLLGKKRDGGPWKIGIQDPLAKRGSYMGIVTAFGGSITTAGIYERFFEVNGTRYHHILDLSRGFPAESGLIAVTVIAPTSALADGIDTALLILGRERGMRLAARIPGLQVVMVDDQKRVWLSPGANRSFALTGETYTLAE